MSRLDHLNDKKNELKDAIKDVKEVRDALKEAIDSLDGLKSKESEAFQVDGKSNSGNCFSDVRTDLKKVYSEIVDGILPYLDDKLDDVRDDIRDEKNKD